MPILLAGDCWYDPGEKHIMLCLIPLDQGQTLLCFRFEEMFSNKHGSTSAMISAK